MASAGYFPCVVSPLDSESIDPNRLDNSSPLTDNGRALNAGYLISIIAHFQSKLLS